MLKIKEKRRRQRNKEVADEKIAPELDVLLKAINFCVMTKTRKTKTMSWKPWNHQLLWILPQIEPPEVGTKWKSLI